MNDIAELTSINSRAGIAPLTEQFLDSIKDFPWDKLELYFFLDQILFNWIGQETTFTKIVEDIKTHHYELYDLIFQKTYNILNALPKT
jgi:hypothetical protein